MAQWRKVLVSGSTADVSTLNVGTLGTLTGTISNNSSVADSRLSGSFTGSFVGDGSNLDGVTTVFPSTPEDGNMDATKFYVNDGANKFVSGSQLATYVFGEAATGGDAEIASTGAVTIANDAVTNAKLANMTEGTIKVGGGSDAPTDLDAKTAGQIIVGNGSGVASVAVSGDASLASNGALTIADNAVSLAKMAGLARGSIILGDSSGDPSALAAGGNGQILVGDGNDLASVAVTGEITLASNGATTVADNVIDEANLKTSVAGTGLSGGNGDALSIDASQTGITSILAADLVLGEDAQTKIDFETANEIHFDINNSELLNLTGAKISGSAASTGSFGKLLGDGSDLTGIAPEIDGLSALDAAPHATEDHFVVSDDGTEKKITTTNVAKGVFALVTGGDVLIDSNGAATIQANSVALSTDTTGDYVRDITAGTGMTSTGATTGEGIQHSLSVDAAQTGITSVLNASLTVGRDSDNVVDFAEDDIIKLKTNGSERLRADNAGVDVTGALTVSSNATVEGDLVVNGTTTTISSTNLKVKDAFIFAATGSAGSNVDGGLIVQEGATDNRGSAIYHDTADNRWSVAKAVNHDATAVTPLEHVVTVKQLGDNDAPIEGDKEYGAGEMAINSNGSIWIYS